MQLLGQYRQIEDRMKTLSRNNQVDELRNLLNTDLLSNSEAVNTVLNRLLEINTQQTQDTNQQAADQYDSAFNLVITLLVIATALTLLLAWLLTNSITQPIANALSAAEQIAEGNLTRPRSPSTAMTKPAACCWPCRRCRKNCATRCSAFPARPHSLRPLPKNSTASPTKVPAA
ncbi:methyl-accepting chemotaxis protein [Pseudomonas baetica]|nr:methyl-accepting chemotaxis protein [Pseudomonas baetica]